MAFQLTEQQAAVVNNRGGALLVSAAAGSGKTRVLVAIPPTATSAASRPWSTRLKSPQSTPSAPSSSGSAATCWT